MILLFSTVNIAKEEEYQGKTKFLQIKTSFMFLNNAINRTVFLEQTWWLKKYITKVHIKMVMLILRLNSFCQRMSTKSTSMTKLNQKCNNLGVPRTGQNCAKYTFL